MRVSSISVNYPVSKVQRAQKQSVAKNISAEPSFGGKNDCAKALGGFFGILGGLGATVGLVIMTGGVALPAVLACGGACGATGAILGHQIDKDSRKDSDKNKD